MALQQFLGQDRDRRLGLNQVTSRVIYWQLGSPEMWGLGGLGRLPLPGIFPFTQTGKTTFIACHCLLLSHLPQGCSQFFSREALGKSGWMMGMKTTQRSSEESEQHLGKDSPGPLMAKRRQPPETEKGAPNLYEHRFFQTSYCFKHSRKGIKER